MSGLAKNAEDPTDPPPPESAKRVPPVYRELARILVRLALEEEGILEPENDNT